MYTIYIHICSVYTYITHVSNPLIFTFAHSILYFYAVYCTILLHFPCARLYIMLYTFTHPFSKNTHPTHTYIYTFIHTHTCICVYYLHSIHTYTTKHFKSTYFKKWRCYSPSAHDSNFKNQIIRFCQI